MKKIFAPALLLIIYCCCSCNNGTQQSTHNDSAVVKQQPTYSPSILNDSAYTPMDRSPMDMAYFPADYPMLKMNGSDTGSPVIRLIYSRPQKNGRVIFGDSDKNPCGFGKEWRLGANEASEIEFFKPVKIQGEKIIPGRYVIYCIPYPNKWTICLNSELFTWGLHIDRSKDIARFDIPVTATGNSIEVFTMEFVQSAGGANLIMAWDQTKTELPVSF